MSIEKFQIFSVSCDVPNCRTRNFEIYPADLDNQTIEEVKEFASEFGDWQFEGEKSFCPKHKVSIKEALTTSNFPIHFSPNILNPINHSIGGD